MRCFNSGQNMRLTQAWTLRIHSYIHDIHNDYHYQNERPSTSNTGNTIVATSTHNSRNNSQISETVPSPFKRSLLWPEPREITNKRKKKEIIPSVVTSKAWQEYYENKEKKKIVELELKRERALARQRKKEEQTAENKRKAEEKAMKMKMKTTKQRKKKMRKEETSSEDEGSWIPSDGSSTNDVTLDVEDTMQFQENIEPPSNETIGPSSAIKESKDTEERGESIEGTLNWTRRKDMSERHSRNTIEKERESNILHENDFVVATLSGKKRKYKCVCKITSLISDNIAEVIVFNSINRMKSVFAKNEKDVQTINISQIDLRLPKPLIFGRESHCQFSKGIDIDK
ncbi:uncharacterized protein LOC111636065 [Centruroides sculpturatus]|uniref:uncharacterized protein LOC111636065 n=1 Tax=Centruroides sculpturatus TaxID=218467 RepID=UPI000C6E74E8|nr:uncharacterized protein LOC111636065 [Centruroides sculpturatus]